jgi:hypothetical protein
MRMRNVGRLICMFVLVVMTGITAAACGSSGGDNVFAVPDGSIGIEDGSFGDVSFNGDSGNGCKAKTCKDLGYTCGPNGDGCGHQINCGSCATPQYCGGGGYSKCGGVIGFSTDGGPLCAPATTCLAGQDCGVASDGCGGTVTCGPGCTAPAFCGGGGFSKCGGNINVAPDGAAVCTPMTSCPAGDDCGVVSDGCGGTITCGSGCTAPAFCGGGGFNKCGGNNGMNADGGSLCSPMNCQQLGYDCGVAGDGCGGQLTCGTGSCTAPAFCGGGGFNKCGGNIANGRDGAPLCTPTTCQALGYNCGPAGDGCGGVLNCNVNGGCTLPDICGGSGSPGVCGHTPPCTNFCRQQVACDGGTTTLLSGTVVAGTLAKYLPAGVTTGDPVPNVVVYIPNGTVQPFIPRAQETPSQQCSTCGADVTGTPLVTTTTAFDGTFQLTNVPVGNSIPIVIQLGRWRRQFTVNVNNACGANTVNAANIPAGFLVMPHNQSEGDIPLTALSTGDVDSMECVLLKMGIDTTEFTINASTPNGRIHLYQGNGASATSGATPNEPALMETGGTFNNYDQIVLPCWGVDPTINGSANAKTATELADLVAYANSGGHFFATHYSYAWLYNNNPFNTTAVWDVNRSMINSMTGVVSQTAPPAHPSTFVKWLNLVHALSNFTANPPPPNPANVTITFARHDVDSVSGQSVDWIDGTDPTRNVNPKQMLLHYTFDTPVGQTSGQCGHAIFSDFHVTNQNNTAVFSFPRDADTECGTNPMTAQEKILEYMIWDLASCVPGPPGPTCTPLTCSQQGIGCGPAGDGCGGPLNCGTCTPPLTCGGGGVRGQCGQPDGGLCTPQTCSQLGIGCGPAGDGCGGALNCGPCTPPQTCGGGGTPGQCGGGGTCTPQTCGQQNISCGPAGDGCGGALDCGPCTPPQTCGGGGTPGQCGAPPGQCTPETCAQQNISCGPAGDGCGGQIDCGPCTPPLTCGGGGTPGKCGGGSQCTPLTCAQLKINCGPAGDGCGGLVQCGTCSSGQTCGGAGVPGQCGGVPH